MYYQDKDADSTCQENQLWIDVQLKKIPELERINRRLRRRLYQAYVRHGILIARAKLKKRGIIP